MSGETTAPKCKLCGHKMSEYPASTFGRWYCDHCFGKGRPEPKAPEGASPEGSTYPTPFAYEAACKALHHHRERADRAEAELTTLREALEALGPLKAAALDYGAGKSYTLLLEAATGFYWDWLKSKRAGGTGEGG